MVTISFVRYSDKISEIYCNWEDVGAITYIFEKSKIRFIIQKAGVNRPLTPNDFGFGFYEFWKLSLTDLFENNH